MKSEINKNSVIYMPQDAFTIYHTAKELNSVLQNARVDRVNQPTQDSIVLFLRTQSKNEKLMISANAESARVSVTEDNKEAPLQAPAFCMLLRKHLSHASIERIEAVDYERIIKIIFSTRNEMRESGEKILYCEIMGKYSNITLTEDGKILGAIKQSGSIEGIRPIFPGVTYKLPAPQDKVELSDEKASLFALESFCGADFADYIFNVFKGVSKQTATEIVFRFFGQAFVGCENVKTFKIADFYKHFKYFYETHNYKPNVVMTKNQKDFFITDYLSVTAEKTFCKTINQAVDHYFSTRDTNKAFDLKKRRLTDAVKAYEKKLNKKMQIVLEKLLACKDMDKDRLYGELLIANLYKIKQSQPEVSLENYYLNPPSLVKIKLDDKISPKENAEKYFKKYNKSKKTVAAVEPQKAELEVLLDYVSTLYAELDMCEKIEDFNEIEEELRLAEILKTTSSDKKRKVKPATCRIYQYKGFEVFVGKNNLQNDRLTLSAARTDVWLHTKNYHSSHVIIKTDGRSVPDEVLLFAAEICAFYSKANGSDKIPVDYTLKKFVKKPAGTKVGTVFYTDNKTILVTPNAHRENAVN